MTANFPAHQQLIRLGASNNVADTLLSLGLEPWILLPRDSPWATRLISEDKLFNAADVDAVIADHYPPFDPAVLERVARSQWTADEWLGNDFLTFPGPLNRICDLAEAGVHPMVAACLSWGFEARADILDLIEPLMPPATDLVPVRVADGDVEFIIST
jgi:hypothetical protein